MSKKVMITDPRHLNAVRAKSKAVDEYKKQRLVRKQWLKDQILNHDRIDLLMTKVLDYNLLQDFHMLMWYHRKRCYASKEKQKWHLALAPRGGGKSTILTIAEIILDILKNQNIRLLIASKTDTNSIGFLREIKQKLESKKLIDIFGKQKGNLWNDGEINVAGRTIAAKEPTISTVGYTGALASRHFDKIYADDLVDEENSKTETQRNKLKTWLFKILDPTLEPDGEMNIVGTRYHPEDLYGDLINTVFTEKTKKGKIKEKYYVRIPALIKKKKCKRSWPERKKYISFWPDKFSVKFLLNKKKDQGTIIFNCLTPNTIVLTKDGYKESRHVEIGDYVWNTKWCKVVKINKSIHDNLIYNIRTFYNHRSTGLTGNHAVIANSNFITTDKLKVGDVVQFPINENSSIVDVPVIYRSPEFFKLVGHWLANGCCYGDTGVNRWKTVITLGSHRKKEIEEVKSLVSKFLLKLNKSNNITLSKKTSKVTEVINENNSTHLIFTNKLFWEFIQQFGKLAHNKKLPYWVYDLPENYLLELFKGYYVGDGFYLRSRGDLGINSVSENLLSGFQLVLLKLGFISRVQKVYDAHKRVIDKSNKLRNCRALYGIFLNNYDAIKIDPLIPDFKKRRYKSKGWIKNGVFYVKIKSIESDYFGDTIYDFEVEGNHVLTSGLMTIHNSQMQNDVEAMKGKIFKLDWFNWYNMEEIDIDKLMVFQGVDLAIKQQDTADKFAHCTIGVCPKTFNVYVLDYYNRVTHYTKQKEVIGSKFHQYDPVRVAVEANGYQAALLQDMRTDSKLKDVRAVPVFTDTDKTMRAWKLSAYFERGQVFLLEGMHGLQQHLLKMPDGRYKDLFDALDFAITAAFGNKKKTRKKEPGLIGKK